MEAAAHQTYQASEYFRGPSGRQNYDRLVLFAQKKVMRARFLDPSVPIQPPEHYVNEAIKRCLPGADGQVARDLNRDLPLEVMFKGIIESILSHDLYPSEIRMLTKGEFGYVEDGEDERQLTADDYEQSMWSDKRGDAEIRTNAIRNLDERPVIEAFLKFVSKDAIVHRMALLLLEEDIEEPAELVASRIGITADEVYVARKRRDRMCLQFAQERKQK